MANDELKRIAARIEHRLVELFDAAAAGPSSGIFPTPLRTPVLEEVRELTLRGGKRLRAALVICGASLFDDGAEEEPAVIDAAAALELLHAYFLIHDDIMDDDATRRGGPSLHVALADRLGDPRLGRDLAILAGDLAAALHEGLVSRLDTAESRRRLAAAIFSEMHLDVVHGQTLDMLGQSDAEEVALRKTASYTTVGPLTIGAALGGASPDQLVELAAIAAPIGVAFQLRDDLLGAFGTSKVTGKPVGTDLRRGKRTFLLAQALKSSSAEERAAIEAVLGVADAPDDAVARATAALVSCGARRVCEQRCDRLVGGALEAIGAGGNRYRDGGKGLLIRLGELITKRDS